MTNRKQAADQAEKPKVWIELPKPRDAAHAGEICAMANNMMRRLAKPEDLERGSIGRFEWNAKRSCYCYGTDMGFIDLHDRGNWFSLSYLGRAD